MLEIEVKFFIDELGALRDRLLKLGAENCGRFFETNFRYEDQQGSLLKNRFLLRLRKDKKTTLTFKSSPKVSEKRFKIREELEVEVSSFETMNRILEAIGFSRIQIYEKWRETFTLGTTHFCVDTMPYGNFLEIEGKPEKIRLYAGQLRLNWSERILKNYLELFAIIRRKEKFAFSEVTFDNFKTVTFDIRQYLSLFRET
jgi:adenylate cyclase class 2